MNKASVTESEKIEDNFKSVTDDSYEICISCKTQTDILRSTNIDHRYGYVKWDPILGQLLKTIFYV